MDDHGLAQWLALREAADRAARSATLTERVVTALHSADPVRILDLATGTGSNVRYLIERFPGRRQQWLAIDRSATLLALLPARLAAWGAERGYQVTPDARGCRVRGPEVDCHIETRQMDLGTLPAADVFGPRDLVTASALLDLVSARWLQALAGICRELRAAALFTITYNGQTSCVPADPDDGHVLALFNAHQHTDKGLGGPAAGPDAPADAARALAGAGFTVEREPSDWRIEPDQTAFQCELIEGWAFAALEIAPEERELIESWRERRLRHVAERRSQLTVGHDDVAGVIARGSC